MMKFWFLRCQQNCLTVTFKKAHWDFPSHPVVGTLPSSTGGAGSIPGQGDSRPKKKKKPKNPNLKKMQYCHKFNKDLKMVHIKRKS